MSKHAKPKQETIHANARRMVVTHEESLLLFAIRTYRNTENPDFLGPVTRKFADLLPPYAGDRKREPGRHARRWDA